MNGCKTCEHDLVDRRCALVRRPFRHRKATIAWIKRTQFGGDSNPVEGHEPCPGWAAKVTAVAS